MKRLVLTCIVLTGLHAAPCRADEARIPIYQPTTITQPGHYILTRDVTAGVDPAVTIQADDVTLDLNARTISGAPPTALIVVADGYKDITIRNGRLSGGSYGIRYSSTSVGTRLTIANLQISRSTHAVSVIGAELVSVLSCHIVGGDSDAVFVQGVAASSYTGQFLDNVIQDIGGSGMYFIGLRAGVVRGNTITHFGKIGSFNDAIGIHLLAASDQGGNVIERNTIRGSDDDLGIAIVAGPDNLVASNDVSITGNTGIVITTGGNRVVGNVSSGNGCGICTSGAANRNVFERNHAAGNTLSGISVEGDFNLLDGNVSEGNGQYGIAVSGTGNAYRNNMLRGNSAGAVVGVATDAGGNIL